jgi:CSLREA domain-containing protein
LIVAAIAAAALLAPAAASATTITVNSTVDPTAPAPACTLHDAITAANTNSAVNGCAAGSGITTDTIDFSLPNPSTILLAGALPILSSNMNINGPGTSQLTVSGADAVRPFQNNSISTDSISGMTISHGSSAGGGALNNTGTFTLTDVAVSNNTAIDTDPANKFPVGGGILNSGTLHLVLSSVSGNSATANGATGQNAPAGAGIYSQGTLTLDRSTVSGNTLIAIASGAATTTAIGGGISNSGALTATESTISGNTVSASGGALNSARGGGVSTANNPGVTVTLDRSTVADNLVVAAPTVGITGGGGIQSAGTTGSSLSVTSSTISGNSASGTANLEYGAATTTIKNTIIANPAPGGVNCNTGVNVSQGFNIDSGNTCGFNQASDHINTDPLLGGLADNGGPTQTMAPSCGSPALDQGSAFGALTDQRGGGFARPVNLTDYPNADDGSDIGAVELQTTPGTACLSVTSHDFGSQPVDGGPTAPIAITLTNGGATDITITSAALTGPDVAEFPTSAETCTGTTLHAGNSCAFGVGFDPSSNGAKSAAISFTDDASLSPQQVALTGTGFGPSPPPPSGGGGGNTIVPPAIPDTTLSARVRKAKRKATFTFGSGDAGATFMCKLDKRPFSPCTSPITFKHLRTGKHTFMVEAVDAAGTDPSPATFRFKLKP